MVRKLRDTFVKKETLFDDLGIQKGKAKLSKNELALKAYEANLIDKTQFQASLERRTSTIPCYLYTHIHDSGMRKKIEEYVLAYSMLYTRGTWLANLACMVFSENVRLPTEFPNKDTAIKVPSFLTNENLIKQCFLPECWLLKRKAVDIDSTIHRAYDLFKQRLSPLLPDYKAVMSSTGWGNALNHMGTSYLGNVKVKICTHLLRRLKTYVLYHHTTNPDTNRKSLWHAVRAPASPASEIHEDDYAWAMNVRTALGVLDREKWLNMPEKLNDYVWTLHLWLLGKSKDNDKSKKDKDEPEKEAPYLPVSTLNRKLGLTRPLFNKRRNQIRKQLEQKFKDATDGERKLKQKWANVGHGCLPVPERATVKMVKTDGVGLRICLEFVPTVEELKAAMLKDDPMFKDPFKVSADTGRVRIATTVDDDDKVNITTRKAYYRAQRHGQAQAFEKDRTRRGVPR